MKKREKSYLFLSNSDYPFGKNIYGEEVIIDNVDGFNNIKNIYYTVKKTGKKGETQNFEFFGENTKSNVEKIKKHKEICKKNKLLNKKINLLQEKETKLYESIKRITLKSSLNELKEIKKTYEQNKLTLNSCINKSKINRDDLQIKLISDYDSIKKENENFLKIWFNNDIGMFNFHNQTFVLIYIKKEKKEYLGYKSRYDMKNYTFYDLNNHNISINIISEEIKIDSSELIKKIEQKLFTNKKFKKFEIIDEKKRIEKLESAKKSKQLCKESGFIWKGNNEKELYDYLKK